MSSQKIKVKQLKELLRQIIIDGDNISIKITGDSDPGYGSTSKMLAESAVCLALDSLDVGGGFWTPASSMGNKLLARLSKNAGIKFEIQKK